MAVASAGPYANLHLASDRQPRQHPTTQFFTGRCPSCRPTNSVKALKALTRQQFTVKQACVEPHTSALNAALPAATARAPAAIDRYLLSAPKPSSLPAAHHCCCRSTGQMNTQPFYRPCTTYYVGSVNKHGTRLDCFSVYSSFHYFFCSGYTW